MVRISYNGDMEFSSLIFLWGFLPAVLLLHFAAELLPVKNEKARMIVRNAILLVFSVVFYLWSGYFGLIFLFASILVNFGFGLFMERFSRETALSKRRIVLFSAIFLNVAALVFFKYFRLISMPLAASFIVFQSISYLADVHKEKVKAERNPLNFSLYVALFVQLSQGPIMRYGVLGSSIRTRTLSVEGFMKGIRRFLVGFVKKVMIANTVSPVVAEIFGKDPSSLGAGEAWLGLLLFTLQIYYDFSGYSDMAIGLGHMFGFEISENFEYPYTALSIQEFWRRWHISLSSWFRDYIYIPLGGSRKGLARTLLNLTVVFFVTGLWHGNTWNFVIWGLFFAVFSVLERLFLGKVLKKNPVKPLNWLYTIFVVMMGWVFFRAADLPTALSYFGALFGTNGVSFGHDVVTYFNANLILTIAGGILFAGALQRPLRKLALRVRNSKIVQILGFFVLFGLFAWSIALLIEGSYSPSIYGAF